jgi:plastocyanin domain-containing protein
MTRVTTALVAGWLGLLACRGAPGSGEPVKMTVTRNGYEPWKVPAKAGQRLVLEVTRTTDETCATELVIPEAGVDAKLPLGQAVRIELTPARTGDLRFSCAMRMFQGVIEVR